MTINKMTQKARYYATVATLAAGVLNAPISAIAAPTVQAGTYKVEPNHTQIGFSVLHFGFTYYSGQFSDVTGLLTLDPAHPAKAHLAVSAPVGSVATSSAKLTEELKGADWFDAAKFPNATFVSNNVTQTGAATADISGDLTLHGVTKPVVLHARFIGAGVNPIDKAYTVGFDATATIHRSDFGVAKYVPMVSDDVSLHIAGAFEKQD